MAVKKRYTFHITWECHYSNPRHIYELWDWADENIGAKNFRFRDMSFQFDRESDLVMFALRWK